MWLPCIDSVPRSGARCYSLIIMCISWLLRGGERPLHYSAKKWSFSELCDPEKTINFRSFLTISKSIPRNTARCVFASTGFRRVSSLRSVMHVLVSCELLLVARRHKRVVYCIDRFNSLTAAAGIKAILKLLYSAATGDVYTAILELAKTLAYSVSTCDVSKIVFRARHNYRFLLQTR